VPKGKIALPKVGLGRDACRMRVTDVSTKADFIPATGVLLVCVAVVVLGYVAALWRGVAPSIEVRVVPAPAPAVEAPAGS